MTWLALLGQAAWGGLATYLGYSLGIRRGAKIWEDVLKEERADRKLSAAARGSPRVRRIRFTR